MQVFVKQWEKDNKLTRFYVREVSGADVGHIQFTYTADKYGEYSIDKFSMVGNEAALTKVLEIARQRQPELSDDAALGFVSQNGEVVFSGADAKKKQAALRKLVLVI